MKYEVTVTSIVEAEDEQDAIEHLWDGQTEANAKPIEETTGQVLVGTIWMPEDEALAKVIETYDAQIRMSDTPGWNTIRAVFTSPAEAGWEVMDVASDMGLPIRDEGGEETPLWDKVWDAGQDYIKTLESDPRNVPSGNGED